LKKVGSVGDFIIIVIPHRKRYRKYLLKNIYTALIVTRSGQRRRLTGNYIFIVESNVIILNEYAKLIGTRIKGAVQKELRFFGLYKLVLKSRFFI
jgi:ribosomal protein L14